jgi:hypothetical protein
VRYLLLCLFICSLPFNTSRGQTDSSGFTFWNCPENFNLNILRTPPFAADRLLSAFQFDSLLVPVAGNFRFNSTAYDLQLLRSLPQLALDTNLAVSELRILLGSTREQLIFLDHRQRISRSLTGDINYHSIVSPGFTLNGLSVHRDFRLSFQWTKKWLDADISFRYGKVKAEENGGILDSQSVAGLNKNDFEELRVRAADELRELRRYHLYWKGAFHLLNRDSSNSRLSFIASVEWYRSGTSYIGVADKDVYQQFYLDTAATRDTAGFQYLAPSGGFNYRYVSDRFRVNFDAGVKIYRDLQWEILDRRSTFDAWSPFFSASIHTMRLKIDSRFSLMKGDTLNENDLTWQVALKGTTGGNIVSGYSAEIISSEVSPVLTSMYYRSNHFLWDNLFEKERFFLLNAGLNLFNHTFRVSYRPLFLENYVWYDELALPRQSRAEYLVQQVDFAIDQQVRKWRLFVTGRYTQTSAAFIRLPEWSGLVRLSFTDRFFKKALKTEFGASFYGTSSYKGYAFMPATAMLHLQHEFNTGGVPVMDVFVNAGIGKAILSLTYQRFNNLFSEAEYFLAPGYPGAPSTLKFSVFWPLYN